MNDFLENRCSRCGAKKPTNDFFKLKPDVIYPFYLYYCKECVRIYYMNISSDYTKQEDGLDRFANEIQHLIDI